MHARVLVTWLVLGTTAFAAPKLQTGQEAPAFSLPSTAGTTATLADYSGKWLVVFFYSKAFTPQCTKEVCAVRDWSAKLATLGAVVVGISRDDTDTQKKFKEEQRLPYELLSDPDRAAARAYDVLGFGNIYQRRSFIIDPNGRIAHIFYSVNINEHGEEIFDRLRKLQENSP